MYSLFTLIKSDFKRNYMLKSKFILFFFRFANALYEKNIVIKIVSIPVFVFYKIITEFLLGLELPLGTKVGKGLALYHAFGLVVNPGSVIGDYCTLRQGVTIGNKLKKDGTESRCPRIGDYVEIGANAIIIGDITIGNNAKIGAGTVVTKDIPEGKVAVSSNLRIL
ncbi:serine acetyltransferase [Pseudoalteromonas gelatinilytica]|uniref:Serine acetyltransferase n=1 Tax=Pseudoalteromonas gelatinilytica TaxID=1703256 RepID=A0ABQ1TT07_9GAMM|nr:DapH/DapD/GlmU-related protein [Pseudoalteromonas profundi]GGF00329.1 serine acetyltransferase [Pseudoalteromonas profundi]